MLKGCFDQVLNDTNITFEKMEKTYNSNKWYSTTVTNKDDIKYEVMGRS